MITNWMHRAISAILFVWLTLGTAAAIAQVAADANNHDAEFGGLCVMGLAEGKRIKTDCQVSWSTEGKTYCFRTSDAKTEFLKDPQRNLQRARDHFAAGETSQTSDDMGKYGVEDVKAWLDQYLRNAASENNGRYLVHDALTGNKLALVYQKIDFMRTLHGYGFFPEVVFSAPEDAQKIWLVDFWVKPSNGKLALFDVRIYKAPRKEGDGWTLVKRQPKPWWWIPASEHPGESEQKRSWEIISAIEQHIVNQRSQSDGIFKLIDDKTGDEVALDFVGIHMPVRKLKENGQYFACSDFRKQGTLDEYYDIDFWLDERDGKVTVGGARVHKVPELRDGDMIQVPRYSFDPQKVENVP